MNKVPFFIVFFLILVFVSIKYYNLKEYTIYDAKIIGFEKVNVTVATSTHGGTTTYTKLTPCVEYYKNSKDTIRYYDGKRVLYSSFYKNEKVKVLEDKNNQYNTTIFCLSYYWLEVSEIIMLALFATVFIGFTFPSTCTILSLSKQRKT